MIDLYTWTTPNGRKVSIMLEESGCRTARLPSTSTPDEQFKPEFLAHQPEQQDSRDRRPRQRRLR